VGSFDGRASPLPPPEGPVLAIAGEEGQVVADNPLSGPDVQG
jgi:hypothetical protein